MGTRLGGGGCQSPTKSGTLPDRRMQHEGRGREEMGRRRGREEQEKEKKNESPHQTEFSTATLKRFTTAHEAEMAPPDPLAEDPTIVLPCMAMRASRSPSTVCLVWHERSDPGKTRVRARKRTRPLRSLRLPGIQRRTTQCRRRRFGRSWRGTLRSPKTHPGSWT